jgi:hypothetical protein
MCPRTDRAANALITMPPETSSLHRVSKFLKRRFSILSARQELKI